MKESSGLVDMSWAASFVEVIGDSGRKYGSAKLSKMLLSMLTIVVEVDGKFDCERVVVAVFG